MKLGDIVFFRDEKFSCHRFWEIKGVFHGAEGQESLVELVPLSEKPGTTNRGHIFTTTVVPEPLIRGLVYTPDRERSE